MHAANSPSVDEPILCSRSSRAPEALPLLLLLLLLLLLHFREHGSLMYSLFFETRNNTHTHYSFAKSKRNP